jgi:hypothetical protein
LSFCILKIDHISGEIVSMLASNEVDRRFELRVNPKTLQLLFVASLLGIKVKEKRMIRSKLNYVSELRGMYSCFSELAL